MKKVVLYILSTVLLLGFSMLLLAYKADIPVEELKKTYSNSKSRFVDIDDMSVHYRIEGQGPPLLLLHGTGASLHTWDAWADLMKSEYQIIRLDLPAFGLTGPNPEGDYSSTFYSQFIHQFLSKIGIEQCSIAGNSLGGQIAWSYALDYPKQVVKLILIDASGYPRKSSSSPALFKLVKNPLAAFFLKQSTPKFIYKKNLKSVYFDDDKVSEPLVQRYLDLSLRQGNRQAFIDRINSKRPKGKTHRSKDLSKIKIPTLILWGEHDTWIPVASAHRFKADIPNAELIIYPDAGHVPMEEIPVKTARDVMDFLQ